MTAKSLPTLLQLSFKKPADRVAMRNFLPIYRRELWVSFATPLAATLLVIYLVG